MLPGRAVPDTQAASAEERNERGLAFHRARLGEPPLVFAALAAARPVGEGPPCRLDLGRQDGDLLRHCLAAPAGVGAGRRSRTRLRPWCQAGQMPGARGAAWRPRQRPMLARRTRGQEIGRGGMRMEMHRSRWATKLLAGQAPTTAEWEEVTLAAHRRHPGMTTRWMGAFPTTDGLSSYEWLVAAVAAAYPAGTGPLRLLDLACGDGYLLERCLAELGGRGWQVRATGVDLSPEEIAAARARLAGRDVTLLVERAQRLSLGDRAVDVAVSHMALMMIAPLEPAVVELGRVLVPGGLLAAVISRSEDPDPAWAAVAAARRAFFARAFPRMDPAHQPSDPRLNTRAGLAELFGPARGFTGTVAVDDFDLVLEGPVAEVWDSVAVGSALLGVLDAEQREQLGVEVRAALAAHADARGQVRAGFPLRRIAVRAAS